MSWPLTYTTYGQLLDDNLNPQDSSAFTGPHPVSAPAELRGAGGNHYTLAGKELDTESGLTNFGARYYRAASSSAGQRPHGRLADARPAARRADQPALAQPVSVQPGQPGAV